MGCRADTLSRWIGPSPGCPRRRPVTRSSAHLLEVDAAIALVLAGIAVTITLCCFEGAGSAAFTGAAWAQAAGVAFQLRDEPPAPVSLVIGPRLRPVPVRLIRRWSRDRGTEAAPRPKGGRPAGSRRSAARPVLPLHGPRSAGRARGGVRPAHRPWSRPRPTPGRRLRAAAVERGGDGGTPAEAEGARDLQLGRHLLVCLRDGGDPARPGRRRRGRLARVDPGIDSDRAPPGGGLGLVSAGLSRLPERWRSVRRRPDEPRTSLRAHRCGRTPDRLCDDGRRLDGCRDHPDPVGLPRGLRHPHRDRVRVDSADHCREPPRPARVRQHLRGPDLPVRRARAWDRRHRGVPHRDRDGRRSSRHSRMPFPSARRRSGSFSCSRHSPAVPWR